MGVYSLMWNDLNRHRCYKVTFQYIGFDFDAFAVLFLEHGDLFLYGQVFIIEM